MPHRRHIPELEISPNSVYSAHHHAAPASKLLMVTAEHRAVHRAIGSLQRQIHMVSPTTRRIVRPSLSETLDLVLRTYVSAHPSWARAIGIDRLRGGMAGERDTWDIELSHFAHATLSTHFHHECARRGVAPSTRGWADTVCGVYIDALTDDRTMARVRGCQP